MISPHFRYCLISTLVGVRPPVACGHSCYKTQVFKSVHFRKPLFKAAPKLFKPSLRLPHRGLLRDVHRHDHRVHESLH